MQRPMMLLPLLVLGCAPAAPLLAPTSEGLPRQALETRPLPAAAPALPAEAPRLAMGAKLQAFTAATGSAVKAWSVFFGAAANEVSPTLNGDGTLTTYTSREGKLDTLPVSHDVGHEDTFSPPQAPTPATSAQRTAPRGGLLVPV